MKPAEALASLPDDTRISVVVGSGDMTVGEWKAALLASSPAVVTTQQAAAKWSRTPEWWAERAFAGDIRGAIKDGGGWRLPVESCREYLASLSVRKAGFRGPWGASTQTARVRSPDRKAG